ncbi:DUF2341 domain-containing protein [Methanothermococcus sp.]|uniref:DUF2341 domain-containing protein n=1 Tax=Methanothermococcus sp. TaxID=2614238 RepID=UPI0025F9CD97|nr:DUF2341 domain-containing protein [Methanothermococcus sp.]
MIVVDGTSAKADIGNGANYFTTISHNGDYFGVEVDGLTGAQYIDNFIIRKYADQEPSASIDQISTDTWKVTIYNPNSYDLTDFQVKINGTGIVSSKTDSLLITDGSGISNATLSFNVISTELKPHQAITINITNATGNVTKYIINWGDGAITELNSNETLANHTYDFENSFKITATSYSQENVLATNSTTVKVVYNISEIPYKYLIKVANPTSQNYTNYPLKIALNENNFNFFIPKPLGTDIYFRDANGTIYKHFIENYSIADQKATIWVQIPYIAPNSYAEFYLCIDKDGKDRTQYTFDNQEVNPQILWAIIPEFSIDISLNQNTSLITRLSSNTNNYQNVTIIILDDMTYLKENEYKGTIKFITENGEQVIYSFNRSYVGGKLEVPASSNTGLCTLTTTNGIVRKIKYNVSNLNIIYLPNGNSAPVLLKGASGKNWFIYKTDGSFVTLANDDSVVYLAPGGEYDFYVEDIPIKKGYTVLGSGDVLYAELNPMYYPKLITTVTVLGNDSINFTISTNKNITINFSDSTAYTIGAGETRTFTKPYDTTYTIYYNGVPIKSGILQKENWGLLGEFPQKYPQLAHWTAFGIVLLCLLAGSFITIYIAVPMATLVLLILARLGWIQLDPLSSSIFILIGLGSFVYFFMKRNW